LVVLSVILGVFVGWYYA